jgi:PHD/YefM family antitoxin component YafN of YafNO toxin-antitoxin module
MDTNIISTTQIQRNIKLVFAKLSQNKEPLIVVRDSIPQAVMMSYSEYIRISNLEKKVLKDQMEQILVDLSAKNASISNKQLEKDVTHAIKATRRH